MFTETDINERLYWLMSQLNMHYGELIETPWEVIEWLYARHLQYLIDVQKQKNEQSKTNSFI